MALIKIRVDKLRIQMVDALIKAGLLEEQSYLVADAILDAECSGIHSHGLMRFPVYLKQLREGIINTNPQITLQRMNSVINVNGDNGPGILVADKAMNACIDGAKKHGICAAAVSGSNHFGVAAYYTRKAALTGCIGFICSTAGPTMAPFGGRELLLGTDPFSISFPYDNEIFSIDVASSMVAKGKIRTYAQHGKDIPLGWALDDQGNPTTDPKAAIKGILLPMAGHKGYGIALAVEALSALLSGAKLSYETQGMFGTGDAANIGHFCVAIDINHFISEKDFRSRAGEWLNMIKNSSLGVGVESIMIPGEMESTKRKCCEQEVEIEDVLYNELFK